MSEVPPEERVAELERIAVALDEAVARNYDATLGPSMKRNWPYPPLHCPRLYYWRGHVRSELGDLDAAEGDLTAAVVGHSLADVDFVPEKKANAAVVDVLFCRGTVLATCPAVEMAALASSELAIQRLEAAERDLSETTRINPHHIEAADLLDKVQSELRAKKLEATAYLSMSQGSLTEAIEQFDEMFAHDDEAVDEDGPKHLLRFVSRQTCYIQRGHCYYTLSEEGADFDSDFENAEDDYK